MGRGQSWPLMFGPGSIIQRQSTRLPVFLLAKSVSCIHKDRMSETFQLSILRVNRNEVVPVLDDIAFGAAEIQHAAEYSHHEQTRKVHSPV